MRTLFQSLYGHQAWADAALLSAVKAHPDSLRDESQVILHSQNHRGQCLTRLRENGAHPPTLDYILWVKDRPKPE